MLTGTTYFPASAFISNFYKINNQNLANDLIKVATGKRINQPKDGIGDYFRADNINRENQINQIFLRDIVEAKSVATAAEKAGVFVFETISEMKNLAKRYWRHTFSRQEKETLVTEFEALKSQVNSTIESSFYNGKKLIADSTSSPLYTLMLNPYNLAENLKITFNSTDVADVRSLVIDGPDETAVLNAIDAQLSRAGAYLAKASCYSKELDTHWELFQQKIEINKSLESNISDAEAGSQISSAVRRDIRQQMSIAMLAQANMLRLSVMSLILTE